jgi:hypothetical protein
MRYENLECGDFKPISSSNQLTVDNPASGQLTKRGEMLGLRFEKVGSRQLGKRQDASMNDTRFIKIVLPLAHHHISPSIIRKAQLQIFKS